MRPNGYGEEKEGIVVEVCYDIKIVEEEECNRPIFPIFSMTVDGNPNCSKAEKQNIMVPPYVD